MDTKRSLKISIFILKRGFIGSHLRAPFPVHAFTRARTVWKAGSATELLRCCPIFIYLQHYRLCFKDSQRPNENTPLNNNVHEHRELACRASPTTHLTISNTQ